MLSPEEQAIKKLIVSKGLLTAAKFDEALQGRPANDADLLTYLQGKGGMTGSQVETVQAALKAEEDRHRGEQAFKSLSPEDLAIRKLLLSRGLVNDLQIKEALGSTNQTGGGLLAVLQQKGTLTASQADGVKTAYREQLITEGKRIGDTAVQKMMISQEQLDKALEIQTASTGAVHLADVLAEQGFITTAQKEALRPSTGIDLSVAKKVLTIRRGALLAGAVAVLVLVIVLVRAFSGSSKDDLLRSLVFLAGSQAPECASGDYPCKKKYGEATWDIDQLPDATGSGITSIPLRGPSNIVNGFLFLGHGVFRDRLPTLFVTWGDKMKDRGSSSIITKHLVDKAAGYVSAESTGVLCPKEAQCLAVATFRKGRQISASYTMFFNRQKGQYGGQSFDLLLRHFREQQARLPKMQSHIYATQVIKGAGVNFEAQADVRFDQDFIFGVERNLTDTTTGPSRWRQWYFAVNVFAIRKDKLTKPLFEQYTKLLEEELAGAPAGGKCQVPCEACLKRRECAQKAGKDRWNCEADCYDTNNNCCKAHFRRPLSKICGCR